jgi:hypothetical protein
MRVSAALFELVSRPRRMIGPALGLVLSAAFALPTRALAQGAETPATAPPGAPADPTEGARRHFRNGVKLYQDTNYPGALAEFEAAYQLKPGASSLQNVALCQKALFRYGESADTLTLLLERHSDELSVDEQRALRLAIDELMDLVGSLVISVQPPHARVALDGQVIPPEQLGKRLRTNVGEHTVVAEAPGYARLARTLRVASGQHDQSIELALEPMMGFLDVVTDDPQAVIALDRKPLARHRWSGPVTPDEDHLVQVYRSGYESFEQVVQVAVGKTSSLRAALGPALDDGAEDDEDGERPGKGLPPPPGEKKYGWYGMAALSVLGAGSTPLALDVSNARASTEAGAIGLRAGYRFWRPIAGELMLDFGNLRVTDACDPALTAAQMGECGTETQVGRDYDLSWMRVGPNLRLLSNGERVRFVAGAGVGAVFHQIQVDAVPSADLAAQEAFGVDPYFALELGIGFNFGQWLVETVALASIDGTSALKSDLADKAEGDRKTLPIVGLSLKFGYSQWKPR